MLKIVFRMFSNEMSKKNLSKKENDEMKQNEKETLEKIKREDYYERVHYDKLDLIGDLAGRVLERSLYLYRNR